MMMEKQVTAMNNTLVNFFKRNVPNSVASSFSTMSSGCQICKGGDHIAIACPRLNEPRPKCAKCGMSHRTENCGVKCSFCARLGHSKDRCWKKPKDGRSHSRAANFIEILLNDEEAALEQLNRLCGNEKVFSYTRVPWRRMPIVSIYCTPSHSSTNNLSKTSFSSSFFFFPIHTMPSSLVSFHDPLELVPPCPMKASESFYTNQWPPHPSSSQ